MLFQDVRFCHVLIKFTRSVPLKWFAVECKFIAVSLYFLISFFHSISMSVHSDDYFIRSLLLINVKKFRFLYLPLHFTFFFVLIQNVLSYLSRELCPQTPEEVLGIFKESHCRTDKTDFQKTIIVLWTFFMQVCTADMHYMADEARQCGHLV